MANILSTAALSNIGKDDTSSGTRSKRINSFANTALNGVSRFWFILAVGGQWIFALYVALYYGGAVFRGEPEAWNKFLPNGYIEGDILGNILLAFHLAIAVALFVIGPLQFVSRIRVRAPRFHRWSGRIYLTMAIAISVAAIYLKFIRELHEHIFITIGFTINGILIVVFALMAWRCAMNKQFVAHRRWALRTFMMVGAIWFYRTGYAAWFIINQGPVGHTEDMRGPFDAAWGLLYVFVTLLILELYLYVKAKSHSVGKLSMAGFLLGLTLLMGISTLVNTLFFWLPNIVPGMESMTPDGDLNM